MSKTYDVVVVGAGPAGANAALAASENGSRVAMIDEQPKAGGQVWRAKDASIKSAPETPETLAGETLRARINDSGIAHKPNARVWQIARQDHGWDVHVLRDGKSELITCKALILAAGAREYVQPIPGWTTPGVVGLAGATALFKQNLSLPGKRVVVSGTGPLVMFVASEVRRLGGQVAAVVTLNSRADWLKAMPAMVSRPGLLWRGAIWMADLMLSGVPIHWQSSVARVDGDDRVSQITLTKLTKDWAPTGATKTVEADSLCLGHGLIPNTEAAQLAGVKLVHKPALGGWVPEVGEDGATVIPGLFLTGDGAGIRGAAAAEIHGQIAGLRAVESLGGDTKAKRQSLLAGYGRAARFGSAMTALSIPRPGLAKLTTDETVVCRCESLRKADVSTEISSGAASTNAVKSGLRAGMGPCGGKYCQTAVARMIAASEGINETDVPPPTPRPPLRPVPASALAGDFDYSDLPIPKPAPL